MEQNIQSAQSAVLPASAHIGYVTLTIADLEHSLSFYQQIIGFQLLARTKGHAALGIDGEPLLVLNEHAGATAKPHDAVGLYHFAILVPDRIALSHTLVQLARSRYPLAGASDHSVSEALYLSDPDGNGIEIYRDRLRSTWKYRGDEVAMVTEPLDIDGVLAEAKHIPADQQGFFSGTKIGHMHLQVANLETAKAFYCGLIGFEVSSHMPGALFVSAGGYHHHLGLNTWDTRNGKRAPEGSAGLQSFSIALSNTDELAQIEKRLKDAQQSYTRQGRSISINDPWDNQVILTAGSFSIAEL